MIRRLIRSILPKPIAHRLAAWLRKERRKRFVSREVQHTYCGVSLRINIGDAMAEGWYDRDWTDTMHEIEWLSRSRLQPGARVFDIGAHQGVVALLLRHRVGPTGSLLAVEADPWNARAAEINMNLNDADNITVLNAAVADSDSIPDHQTSAHLDRVLDWSQAKVPFRSVESLVKQFGRPDVVYVDVDGFEEKVLIGAAPLLDGKTDWFVEIHVGCGLEDEGSTWQKVVSFFPPNRFKLLIGSDASPSFVPFEGNSALVESRFYLLALGA
jgi:FkbM family methyltransferase